MAMKTFKLVPIKQYEDLVARVNPSPHTPPATKNTRSLTDIQQEYSQIGQGVESDIQQEYSQIGQGVVWTNQNENILPQFSKQAKLESSFDQYKSILEAKIPDDLKIKLLNYYRMKYDNTKRPKTHEEHDDNETIQTSNDFDMKHAISNILSETPLNMRPKINKLATVLLNKPKYLEWDVDMKIIKPQNVDHSIMDIRNLLNILIYANRGSQNEITQILPIIKPFYKDILRFIRNKKILKKIELWDIYKKPTMPNHYETLS